LNLIDTDIRMPTTFIILSSVFKVKRNLNIHIFFSSLSVLYAAKDKKLKLLHESTPQTAKQVCFPYKTYFF